MTDRTITAMCSISHDDTSIVSCDEPTATAYTAEQVMTERKRRVVGVT